MSFLGNVIAQQSVSGTVTDQEGEPLIGVNIIVQGTAQGTVTDFDGTYQVEVPSGESVLVFSYTGYAQQEIPVNGRSTINVTMEESAELLDEVVVSALGFTQRKDEMGSTYSTIAADDMVRSGEATMVNGLAGRCGCGQRIRRPLCG